MRFLGVTETCDLGSLYMRLIEAGHEVRVSVSEPLAQGTMAGLVPRTQDWRAELDWVRAAGRDGIILFEAVSEGFGALQDELRRSGFNVIGGSAFGDRLENDRAYGQALLRELGLQTAQVWEFEDEASALSLLKERPARYVLKFSGPDFSSADNYVGETEEGRDVAAVLAAKLRQRGRARFVLMEHIEGIEMGVGAYFDGERFLEPACIDWEHKRFFAGDMGELTGEMGTIATFDRSRRFFQATLAKVAPHLRQARHVGYVNLNTIVNERGIWPLEFTSRFGYPGFAVLEPLQATHWGDLFRTITQRWFERFEARPGFCACVLLTTPPFPYSRDEVEEPVGLPVLIEDEEADRGHIHFGEVGLAHDQLVTSGLYGWTLVVTGTGASIGEAKAAAYARIDKVRIPNMRYRLDIGDRLIRQWSRLEALGLLD